MIYCMIAWKKAYWALKPWTYKWGCAAVSWLGCYGVIAKNQITSEWLGRSFLAPTTKTFHDYPIRNINRLRKFNNTIWNQNQKRPLPQSLYHGSYIPQKTMNARLNLISRPLPARSNPNFYRYAFLSCLSFFKISHSHSNRRPIRSSIKSCAIKGS